jgi:hypothetical protein
MYCRLLECKVSLVLDVEGDSISFFFVSNPCLPRSVWQMDRRGSRTARGRRMQGPDAEGARFPCASMAARNASLCKSIDAGAS